jgi:hypothetical protein
MPPVSVSQIRPGSNRSASFVPLSRKRLTDV